MTSRAFVCDTCKRLVTWPQDRMEKRLEFRRVTDQGRYKTRVIAHVCRQCVDIEMARPDVQLDGQESLLP